MKKVMLIGILFCMVMSLTACDLKDATPEAMHQTIAGIVGWLPDVDGKVTTVLHFVSGGNYIMVDYADFTGTIEMTCEELQDEENRD